MSGTILLYGKDFTSHSGGSCTPEPRTCHQTDDQSGLSPRTSKSLYSARREAELPVLQSSILGIVTVHVSNHFVTCTQISYYFVHRQSRSSETILILTGVQQFGRGSIGSSRGQLHTNLRHYSKLVDEQVNIIRLRREADSAETQNIIANIKAVSLSDQGNIPVPCLTIRSESSVFRTIGRSLPGPRGPTSILLELPQSRV